MKRLTYFGAVYFFALLVLAAAGFVGSMDSELARYAQAHFSAAEIARGRDYFIWGLVPSVAFRIFLFVALFELTRRRMEIVKFLPRLRRPFVRMFLALFAFFFLLFLVQVPFAAVAGYWRDARFGLMRAGFPVWLGRFAASELIFLSGEALVAAAAARIMERAKRPLLVVTALFFSAMVLVTVVYPRLYIPLFYESRELEQGLLRTRVAEVLKRAGYGVADIRVLGTGRYSAKVNALFTGFGPDRIIYLYDTILTDFTDGEICAVVAHELCHYREEHVLAGIAAGSLGLLLALFVMERLCSFLFGAGLKELLREYRIIEIFLVFVVLSFAIRPCENALSRFLERRADRYALELTASPGAVLSLERKLALRNRAYILPNPLYTWFYASHPPVLERMKMAESFRAGHEFR